METSNKTVLITGAGSGIGLSTSKRLVKEGFTVWAGIRDPKTRNIKKSAAIQDYANSVGAKVHIVDLDIVKEESCKEAVEKIITKNGKLDILIHNAAHLYVGFAEAFTPEQYMNSLNVNFLGTHILNRVVLPYMRERRDGLLLYIGSGVTAITAPFVTPYVVGKTAQAVLAESLSFELNPFGIESSILMPGLFIDGTSHFETAEFPKDSSLDEPYAKLKKDFDAYEQGFRNLFRNENAPIEGVADKILEIIRMPKGSRPLRPTIDYSDYVAEPANATRDALTKRVYKIMGYSHLMDVNLES
ncbi:SDR family NAD(P)-dependent oxidoreductase [Aquimarina algiphila]|uniref:SDR family NAD(P)-dependent oxidoreductase n=1 Tax=Aquimarina algiphila TaxID=2047982 RepID=UPI00232D2B91|nr:SDR family NAD(P)-dependent oxidoreductase [Aquimarina algiphila]